MPQSLSLVIIHVIFSTKDRRPFLTHDIRSELYPYMATVARSLDCECYRIGGIEDHVHLAIRLGRTVDIAKLINVLKTSSTGWVKSRFNGTENFAWQRGYGVFSVTPTDLAKLIDYIHLQVEHHRDLTYKEEYLAFLSQHGMHYDERYLWD